VVAGLLDGLPGWFSVVSCFFHFCKSGLVVGLRMVFVFSTFTKVGWNLSLAHRGGFGLKSA